MPRFFVPEIPDTGWLEIGGQDAVHIQRSLRLRVGDTVTVCDGQGTDGVGVIASFSADAVQLHIQRREPSHSEPHCAVTLYQGLPKADKMEWIIQKAVELGVTRIVPVQMAHCVAVMNEKSDKKAARWQKIANEAAGQSGRGVLPVVESPCTFAAAAARLAGETAVVCYERGGEPLPKLAQTVGGESVSLVIGPEGGFAPAEIERLCADGARLATLGPRILRCETAPVAALAVWMALTGNME